MVTIKVEGLRQLGERMRRLETRVARRAAGRTTSAGAKVVKAAVVRNIRSNASADGDSIDEGSLLRSVIMKKLGRKDTNLTSEHIVTYRKRRGRKSKGSQATAPHALFVEFGTVNMPAEPNLRNGFEQSKGDAVDAMKSTLEAEIRKAGA